MPVSGEKNLPYIKPEISEIRRFYNAAYAGDIVGVAAFLNKYGNAAVDELTPAGFTALMGAAFTGQRETVALLLERGADVTLRNSSMTAALYARLQDHDGVAFMIEQWPKVNAQRLAAAKEKTQAEAGRLLTDARIERLKKLAPPKFMLTKRNKTGPA